MPIQRTETGGVRFTIYGEPASKANSRKIVMMGKGPNARPASIKSDKARRYERDALPQIPRLDPWLEGDVTATITIYYASRRPDLDESVILDVMQDRIYRNDRQVKVKHIYHRLDRNNPRADVHVEPLEPQQHTLAVPRPGAMPRSGVGAW